MGDSKTQDDGDIVEGVSSGSLSLHNNERSNDQRALEVQTSFVLAERNSSGEIQEDEQDLPGIDERVREQIEIVKQCIITMQRAVAIGPRATRSSSPSLNDTTTRFAVGFERSRGLILHHGRRPPLSREVAYRFPTTANLLEALKGLERCIQEAHQLRQHNADNNATEIIREVARIPNLIFAILTLENENDMQSTLLNLAITRRVMLSKYSVRPTCQDPRVTPVATTTDSTTPRVAASDVNNTHQDSWLLDLLRCEGRTHQQKRLHQKMALQYLELISNLTVCDYVKVLRNAEQEGVLSDDIGYTEDDARAFEEERNELFFAVASLKLLVPHLFSLKNKDVERAAITPVVQWALNDAIRHPFLVGLVFSDIFFHAALLTATRNLILLDIDSFLGIADSNVNDWGYFMVISFGPASVLYFAFRLVGDIFSTAQISWTAFRQNLLYRWTILEIAAVLMVIGSVVALIIHDESRNSRIYFAYQAFTLGLLWIKVLGFLQVLNRKLAAYVLAIFKILHDIWLFILIIMVMVFAFGDMFYTIYSIYRSEDDGGVCPHFGDDTAAERLEERAESPFCKSSRWIGYLGIYRVFVGDFTVNDFDASALTTILFVLLTFFAIIILLNMLIALVLESHEGSLVRSYRLFGRARVALVAKGLLLEEILLPRSRGSRLRGCSVFMRLWAVSVVVVIAVYLISVSVYTIVNPKNDSRDGAGVLAAIVCTVTTFIMLYLVVLGMVNAFAGRGWKKNLPQWARFFHWAFRYGIAVPVTFVTLTLLGAKQPNKTTEAADLDGRVTYGTMHLIRHRPETMGTSAASAIACLETKVDASNKALRNDFKALCAQLTERNTQLEADMRRIEQRILDSLQRQQKCSC